MRRRVTHLALTAALAGCASAANSGHPLLGTWRSDERDEPYPDATSVARTVDELTFRAGGTIERTVTRRYPRAAPAPAGRYDGCTWVQRLAGGAWLEPDGGTPGMLLSPDRGTCERTGCTDPSRDLAPEPCQTGGLLPLARAGPYAVTGGELTVEWGIVPHPAGQPYDVVRYHRTR